jgi:hypothetical protein
MARRDPGNKPALRIGIAAIAVLALIAVILALFVTRMSHPATDLPKQAPSTAR